MKSRSEAEEDRIVGASVRASAPDTHATILKLADQKVGGTDKTYIQLVADNKKRKMKAGKR